MGIFFGHRIYAWREPWLLDPRDADLHTGLEEVISEERPPKATGPEPWYAKIKLIWQ